MNPKGEYPATGPDPWKELGISQDAGDDEIRRAYLQKIKAFPPERSPAEFERIRDAYELLRDPLRRAKLMLLSADPRAPLVSLLNGHESERRFVGPEPWLAVLKESE